MPVIDTNVLLRYLANDLPEQSAKAFALLQEIESGNRTVNLPEAVLVETVQVLASQRSYAIDREIVRGRVRAVLEMPSISIPNKRTYFRALDLYVQYTRLSFVDALCAAHAQRFPDSTVISFDRDFRNLAGVTWEEP